jgi:hypothetical protein
VLSRFYIAWVVTKRVFGRHHRISCRNFFHWVHYTVAIGTGVASGLPRDQGSLPQIITSIMARS